MLLQALFVCGGDKTCDCTVTGLSDNAYISHCPCFNAELESCDCISLEDIPS